MRLRERGRPPENEEARDDTPGSSKSQTTSDTHRVLHNPPAVQMQGRWPDVAA